MVNLTGFDNRSKAPSLIRLGARAFFVLGGLFLTLILLWLWLSWNSTRQSYLQRMSMTAALTAGHAQNYFDSFGIYLEDLAENMRSVDVARHPEAVLPALLRFNKEHPGLGGAAVIRPDGQIVAATIGKPGQPLPNVLSEPIWREDFHANLQAGGLSVNRPQWCRILNQWIIPLRYTVQDNFGEPKYILQTGAVLEKQQALWKELALPDGAAIGLVREDGYLISRFPGEEPEKLYRRKNPGDGLLSIGFRLPGARASEGVIDDREFVGAYRRLQHYPLYAFVSMPRSALVGAWWRGVHVPFYLLLGVLALGGISYGLIAARFSRRMRLIRRKLDSATIAEQGVLPSSGVSEIDGLCEALATTQKRLRHSARNREKSLLAAANAGTYAIRVRDGVVVAADQVFLDMLGMAENEVVGRPWAGLLVPTDSGSNDGSITQQLQTQDMAHRILRFKNRSGRELWLSLAEYNDESEGEPIRHGLAINVSEREWLLATVGSQSARFQALWQLATNRSKSEEEKAMLMLRLGLDTLNMDTVTIAEVGEGRLELRYLLDTLGLFHVGQRFEVCDALCCEVVAAKGSYFVHDLAAHEKLRDHQLLVQMGVHVYASVPIRSAERIYGVLVFLRRKPLAEDFHDDDKAFMELLASWFEQLLLQQQQREVLQAMALSDSLTQLPNRRAAEMRFAEEIARARRDGTGFSIATCDLDRFKLINDHYGHDVGDEVLQQVAQIMRQALREGDWVARWGGEEFILFLHHSHSADAVSAVERIRLAIKARPLQTRQGGVEVTASFGIGVLKSADDDISRVLSEADGCLYEAKNKGRDCIVAAQHAGRSTLWTAGMLQHALQESRVVAAYQVMVDLATGQPVADEALARLVLPDGVIQPACDFIEAAEGINLIHAVDRTIAYQAMSRCTINLQAGVESPGFAHFINLSPQFLARKDMVDELLCSARSLCGSAHIESGRAKPVVLEITERQLLSDFKKLRSDLQPLLDFGFRLALDDFGSGYSSFLYLAELPVSFLKIEGWMVRNMCSNERVRQMVQSVVDLSRAMGITTIAECIEDRETAEMLRDMGVNWGQGYYFGRPECYECNAGLENGSNSSC